MKIQITATIAMTISFGQQTEVDTPSPKASTHRQTSLNGFKQPRPLVSVERTPNAEDRQDKGRSHFSSCCGAEGRRALKRLDGQCFDCADIGPRWL